MSGSNPRDAEKRCQRRRQEIARNSKVGHCCAYCDKAAVGLYDQIPPHHCREHGTLYMRYWLCEDCLAISPEAVEVKAS